LAVSASLWRSVDWSRRSSPIRSTASRCSACTARRAGPPARPWARSTSSWSTCRTWAAASTPSSPPCSMFWKPPPSTARRSGCWTGPTRRPAGRGLTLRPGWESFVGAGPMPMRHGLTLGELGHWFIKTRGLDVDYRVIAMEGYDPAAGPGFGWPLGERSWINPSPNAPNLSMARAYAGTVDDRGGDPVRRPGHHPAAGAVRRPGHRRPQGYRRDAPAGRRNG